MIDERHVVEADARLRGRQTMQVEQTPDPEQGTPDPKVVRWWHWRHRWTWWGEVFSSTTAGLMGAFTGGVSGPWWQERSCTRCGRVQRRRVEVGEGQ